MFLIMGVTQGRKDLDFAQTVLCNLCGRYGHYEVFMTYTCLSLFFIPTFRWNRRYFVRTSCCGTIYELDPEIGKLIKKGEALEIQPSQLTRVGRDGSGYQDPGSTGARIRQCPNCGYGTTRQDFDYCPKCGTRMN